MKAINRETGTEISISTYNQLSNEAKRKYLIDGGVSHVTNNYNSNVKVNAETSDLLGIGKVAETGAALVAIPIVAAFSLFDW